MIGLEINPECSITCADTVLDGSSVTLRRGAEARALTAKEFDLLREMFKNPNVLLSKTRLMGCLYQGRAAPPMDGIIRVYIHRIRRLLEAVGSSAKITTRHGMGWVLTLPAAEVLPV